MIKQARLLGERFERFIVLVANQPPDAAALRVGVDRREQRHQPVERLIRPQGADRRQAEPPVQTGDHWPSDRIGAAQKMRGALCRRRRLWIDAVLGQSGEIAFVDDATLDGQPARLVTPSPPETAPRRMIPIVEMRGQSGMMRRRTIDAADQGDDGAAGRLHQDPPRADQGGGAAADRDREIRRGGPPFRREAGGTNRRTNAPALR